MSVVGIKVMAIVGLASKMGNNKVGVNKIRVSIHEHYHTIWK